MQHALQPCAPGEGTPDPPRQRADPKPPPSSDELRERLAAAERQVQNYENILATVPDLVSVVDASYVYETVSDAYLIAHRRRREEIVGRTVAEVLGEDVFVSTIKERLDRCLAGEVVRYDAWFDFAGLGRRFTNVTYVPRRTVEGEVTGVIVDVRDITGRKRTEEALRQSVAWNRTLLEHTPDYILTLDREGTIRSLNRTAPGYTLEEAIGASALDFLEAASRSTFERELAAAFEGRSPVELELTDTNGADYMTRLVPIRRNGEVDAVLSVSVDITERKRNERRMRKYERRLRSAASGVALAAERERRRLGAELHDLTIQSLGLCKIKLGALKRSLDGRPEADDVEEIRALVDTAIEQSRAVLFDLSPPVLYSVGLAAAIEWLAEKFESEHGLSTTLECEGDPGPLGDDLRTMYFQSVRELLTNVAKHASARNVTITMHVGGSELCIGVRDDGVGFDAGGAEARERDDGSSGFGLFNIRERFRLLGGRVEIVSEPGEGTEVRLVAPRGRLGDAPPIPEGTPPVPASEPRSA